jgi:hypothetical protein
VVFHHTVQRCEGDESARGPHYWFFFQTMSHAEDFQPLICSTRFEYFQWMLETHFGAPSGKEHGLHDKIRRTRNGVCLLLQYLLQSCSRGCVCVLLMQDLLQSCSRGGRRRVEDMCYERRRAEACVDESAHHALVNAGGREIV